MIVVVEGVDCTGKGTVCPKLTAALKAVLYKSPPEHMRAEQDHVNATASDEEHYRYFVRVCQAASEEIARLATAGRNVVVDRYWPTTVAYHRAMGVPASLEDMGPILAPDFIAYLMVSPEVQAIRMSDRGMSPGDRRMEGKQPLLRQMYEEVLANCRNVIRVDTSALTPTQVVEAILADLPLVLE